VRRWIAQALLLIACLVGSMFIATTGHAASFDPQLRWRTLETAHFRIHFHQGLAQVADELSRSAESIYATLSVELRWGLRLKTDVVLIDPTDRANGYATAVPYNAITIFVTGPTEDSTLSLYEDWTDAIFTHELTHVLHLESAHGIVRAAQAVVGRIASTNSVSPWWMVEGLATFQETRHTAGGRGRNPYVDMVHRTAVVEGTWPRLGSLDGLQARLPSGNLRYLFGQDFMQWVADHHGEDVWSKWVQTYGGHIPYLLPAVSVFGESLPSMAGRWRRDRIAEHSATIQAVAARGLLEGERVSAPGSSCSAAAVSPNGARVVWSCSSIRTGSSLWLADGDGEHAIKIKQDFGARSFTWRADSAAFVYAGLHVVNRFNTTSDIYLFDVAKKTTKPLTNGARARDPDFSPGGERLIVVTNRAQNNQLEVLTVDQRRTPLTTFDDHTQIGTPRHDPTGRLLVASMWIDGQRDLWLLDARTGERLRRLTADVANDREPTWGPDGKTVYFSSDRTGIPNIFAIDLHHERVYQVTNVRTGAQRPAIHPSEPWLFYDQYAQDGWEVHRLALDRQRWRDAGRLVSPWGAPSLEALWSRPIPAAAPPIPTSPASGPAPSRKGASAASFVGPAADQDSGGTDNFQITRAKDFFGKEEDYPFVVPPKRTSPGPSLLPRYLYPGIALTPRLPVTPDTPATRFFQSLPAPINIPGLQVSGATGASDPLDRFRWSGFVTWRSDASFVGGGGSITVNRWLPVFNLAISTQAVPRLYEIAPETPSAPDTTDAPDATNALGLYFERRVTGAFTTTWPFSPRSSLFAAYDLSDRKALGALDPAAIEETVPLRGRVGRLSLGYRFAWSQPTATAISPEDAQTLSVVAGVTAPWLGSVSVATDGRRSPLTQIQLSAEARTYTVLPRLPNHVFAFRAAAGAAIDLQGSAYLGNWQLGGNLGDGAFYVRPPEYRMLRGYPYGAARGDNYWLTSAEYRAPIVRIDRGLGALPLFVRVLHAAVFVDAGHAFDQVDGITEVFAPALVGVGAELRLSFVAWWSSALDVRLGYATGVTRPDLAIGPASPGSLWLQWGGAF
jgi:hypothetical protein